MKGKIVQSEGGYWVAKEVDKGSRYISGYKEICHRAEMKLVDKSKV